MKLTQGALVLALLTLASAAPFSPGRPDNPGPRDPHAPPHSPAPPEPINLDIPPDEPPSEEELLELERAARSLLDPLQFRRWLLEIDPARGVGEQVMSMAILNPKAFRLLNPRTPEQIQEEAIAAHAILSPRTIVQSLIPD